jgi:hypothetical protein
LIVSVGFIGKDISRWETPEEGRRGFDRAFIRRRTRLPLGWGSRQKTCSASGDASASGFG